ncbi:hypothetical protein ACIBG0_38185 [Nocardia sp. NPDC050630]|uniref:hypothetical protein n=1 Tax=Nocardia sp. NPDC050630 TaxID=3364321 RepID=UPI0037A424B2
MVFISACFGPPSRHSNVLILLAASAITSTKQVTGEYQRRRELLPAEAIDWPTWRDLACSVDAHPGENHSNRRNGSCWHNATCTRCLIPRGRWISGRAGINSQRTLTAVTDTDHRRVSAWNATKHAAAQACSRMARGGCEARVSKINV